MPGLNTFFDYFDRCFVINLPERKDRRKTFYRQFQRLGCPAVSGLISRFEAIRPVDAGNFSSIGARGCFMSHLNLLRTARDAGYESVLVVEDDLQIYPRAAQRMNEVIAALNAKPWHIAYFGHGLQLKDGRLTMDVPSEKGIVTTHFYAIRRGAITRLVEFLELVLTRPKGHPEGGPMHYDGAVSTFRRANPDINTLLFCDPLGFQHSSKSDITPNWIDQTPLIKRLGPLLHKVAGLSLKRGQ